MKRADRGASVVEVVAKGGCALVLLVVVGVLGWIYLDTRADQRREREAFEATTEQAEEYVAELVRFAEQVGFPRVQEQLEAIRDPNVFVNHFDTDGTAALVVIGVYRNYETSFRPLSGDSSVYRCFRVTFPDIDEPASVTVVADESGRSTCRDP